MTKPPARPDQAYLALRRAIIEQALRPGDKLREDEIGGLFSMSRTLVRQVLARLSADGLVTTGGKRSAAVAIPSLEDAIAVFEVRKALEREVIALVVRRWKPEFATRLEAHVRKEVEAAAEGRAPLSIRLAGDFHILLAEMTGNPVLLKYVTEIVTRCSLILAVFGRPHSAECGVQEHGAIIEALRKGDAAAIALMDDHIGEVESRALITAREPERTDLGEVLASYVDAVEEDR